MSDQDTEPVEVLPGAQAAERFFESECLDKSRHRCGNCGSEHKVRVKLIIPEDAGGRRISTNAIVVCRACEMAADTAAPLAGTQGKRRIINFWTSRQLHERMNNGMATSRGLRSLSQLIRYLMASYVADVERFDDLGQYQDTDEIDVKVNVWVPIEQYEVFKTLVDARGLSVTDAVKSLIRMFDAEVILPPTTTTIEES